MADPITGCSLSLVLDSALILFAIVSKRRRHTLEAYIAGQRSGKRREACLQSLVVLVYHLELIR
jgi:hypothetical protein